jgi:photosystem II stability/assembly factor-like uncharacterized protein
MERDGWGGSITDLKCPVEPGLPRFAGLVLLIAMLVVPGWVLADGPPGVVYRDQFYDVAIRGEQVWVVGFPGQVLHSPDGGRTFEALGPGKDIALLALDMVDDLNGFVAGRQGKVWATSDGGKTWKALATGSEEPLLAIDFIDARTGYVVGNFGTALKTTDGGSTWKVLAPLDEGEDPKLNGVAFRDESTGWMVGEMGLVLRTTDGGNTFTRQESVVEGHFFGVTVLKDGGVLAVGSDGIIALSRDDGETFEVIQSGVERHLFQASEGGGRILVAGASGTLLVARDPAGPYTKVSVPTHLWLGAAALGPSGIGFAVGSRAALLITRDFGETWTRWGTP